MESVDLDMGEIFDDERADDDDIGAVSALPDLPEYGEDEPDGEQGDGDNEDAENTEVLARLKDLSKGAAKKVIRRPQPKLDATRLTGERGIPILPKTFEKLKFKGKGHEAQDLALLMRNMEHWAHRLFPKMPFDEVLERVERLGAKREVQTCVKKMRLDMPILGDDFVGSDKEDDVMRQEDELLPQAEKERDVEEEWEDLLREEHEAQASQTPSRATPGPYHATPRPSQPTPGPSHNTTGLRYDTPGPSRTDPDTEPSTPADSSQKVGSAFTPEQLERMERNKQIAREKRLAKMGIRSPVTPLQARPLSGNSQASQEPPPSSQEVSSTNPDRVTSPDKQSTSQINSQSSTNSDNLDKNYLDNMSSNTLNKQLDSQDQEMSEVIKDLKETVVVKKQDAQNWCTEPSNQTESSETSENTFTETEDQVNKISDNGIEAESIDSEEMSEVIQQQNAEKVNLNKPSSNSQTENSEKMAEIIDKQDILNKSAANSLAENYENSEEMSEIIDKQDENKLISNKQTENSKATLETIGKEIKKPLLESNKENLSVPVNGIDECSKTKTDDLKEKGDNRSNKLLGAVNGIDECSKTKTDELIEKGDNRLNKLLSAVNGDIDMAGDKTAESIDDQLDEDELMETLDS